MSSGGVDEENLKGRPLGIEKIATASQHTEERKDK